MTWSRRTALKSGLAVTVGALGASALEATPAGAATKRSFNVRLGPARHETVGKRVSQLRRRGDTTLTQADVLDSVGRVTGSFECSGVVTNPRRRNSRAHIPGIHTHVFRLPDGDVVGAGSPRTGALAGAYAVLGGTGRFAGCRGSYEIAESTGRGALVTFVLFD
jgi:hypothetical protein